jgi:NitT/TauT family transport system substrate-binding protein
MVAQGDVDLAVTFAGTLVHEFDLGRPLIAVGGLHVGCYELFAREPIRSIRDLKGRRVSIHSLVSDVHIYVSIMAANIGLDPTTDIEWVPNGSGALESYAAGETDAFLGFPPEPQELRVRGHRRVILNTVLDHPWSQYYCCLMFSNPTWVSEHPSATKRALRAMYQAAEFCTAQPKQAAQRLYDGGFVERYDYALETIQSIPYDRWHEYDAEDTLRFFALRMHEAGLLNNNPNTLLAEGTDWRFVNELKREMKA